ncbi:MAG: tetratricopeptide repeat protein [Pseudomonadota bacterium]
MHDSGYFLHADRPGIGCCRLALITLLIALLSACAAPAPVPESGTETVEERVRAPSQGDRESLQVFTLRNPAVVALGEQAESAEQAGNLQQAEQLLERALRIESRDPAILQHMAEIQLSQNRLETAIGFATRAFEQGPRVGELCERSLRTLALAYERSGSWTEAQSARDQLDGCRVAPPERF